MMARQRMRVSMAKLFDKMEDWKTHTFWIAKWFPTDRDKGTSVRQLPYPLLIKVPHDLGQYRQPFSHRIGQVHKHHSENSAESGTPPVLNICSHGIDTAEKTETSTKALKCALISCDIIVRAYDLNIFKVFSWLVENSLYL